MRGGPDFGDESMAGRLEAVFGLPPGFDLNERRMATRAHERWIETGYQQIIGFESHSTIIADPGGMAFIESVGASVAAAFGLCAGMTLDGQEGLAAELRAACDLIAIVRRPLPFEASVPMPGGATILARGVVLPLAFGADKSGGDRDCVQAIVNWRQLLTRSAASRLRREVAAALRMPRPAGNIGNPFASDDSV